MIKGKSIIELVDKNTGAVSSFEDENMVTDAVPRLFRTNGFLLNTCLETKALPICPVSIGGVIVFPERLEAEESNIYAPIANFPTGYANTEVNSTDNPSRGSYNEAESGEVENGYKFVFDFTTDQANGKISALALTHPLGGASYYGDSDTAGAFTLLKSRTLETTDHVRRKLVEMDFDTGIGYSINYASSTITITKVKIDVDAIDLNSTLMGKYEKISETVLTCSVFTLASYYVFLDGRDGYWYGFANKANSTGTATLYWVKIDKEDFSFEEGKWTFASTYLHAVGYFNSSGTAISFYRRAIIRDGYLYAMNQALNGVYRINLSNIADIKLISLGRTVSYVYGNSYYQNFFILANGVLIGNGFNILPDDTVVQTKVGYQMGEVSSPIFCYNKMFYVGWSHTTRFIYLLTPYLATINNVDTVVTKTADKSMKITYILTMEEEDVDE